MILEIGIVDDPERVGFYSGIIESIFSFMSFLFGTSPALYDLSQTDDLTRIDSFSHTLFIHIGHSWTEACRPGVDRHYGARNVSVRLQ